MSNCMMCNANAVVTRQENSSRTIYNCQNCGIYVVSDVVEEDVKRHQNEITSFLMSRMLAGYSEIVLITYAKADQDKGYIQLTVDQIVRQFPTNFTERMDKALLNLARMSQYGGDEIMLDTLMMAPLFYINKINYEALSFVIKSMQKFELIEVNYYSGSFFPCGVVVSPKGWDRATALMAGEETSTTVFLAATKDLEQTDLFYQMAGKAVEECRYNVAQSSMLSNEGMVNHQLIAQVKESRFVVCDFTGNSGDVYYVAALAKTLGKVCILTCHEKAKRKLKIDRDQMNVLFWDEEEKLYLEVLNAVKALVD